MTNDEQVLLDSYAKAAISGVIGNKEVWSGDRGKDTKSMMASQGFNGSNSITPERAAYWAYEVAQAMLLKSKTLKDGIAP